MDAKTLQQKIEERATKRFEADFRRMITVVKSDPILCQLIIKVGDRSLSLARNYIDCTVLLGLINDFPSVQEGLTNYEKIKTQIINQYIEEETKKILDAFDNIQELMINNKKQ